MLARMRPDGRLARLAIAIAATTIVACASRTPRESTPATAPDDKAGRPNIVLVVVDTLRADALGSYGATSGATPELDRLAAQGVLFERVVAPCSWTRPSMGALLTGLYPRSLGLFVERNQILPRRVTTLAEALHEAGYTTLGATANPTVNSVFNFHQGFDRYDDSLTVFDHVPTRGEHRDYDRDRLASAVQLFDVVLDAVRGGTDFPYYLQLDVMEVHEYGRGALSLTRDEFAARFEGQPNGSYRAAVAQASRDVDAFVRTLSALHGWGNTLFVLTSDHGQGLDSHPGVALSSSHGLLLYESNVLVPLIFYQPRGGVGPNGKSGRRVSQPVRLLDVTPTLLDLAGVPVPAGLDGRSLRALLGDTGEAVDLPPYFVTETYFRKPVDKQAVYAGPWTYHRNNDGQRGTDLRELQRAGVAERGRATNEREGHPDVAEALDAYLEEWLALHPKAEPTPFETSLSEDEVRQLKAIGYLE